MLPVALQLYSIRDEVQKDMKAALQKVKNMGYDGVEFAGLYGHTPAEVKAICEEVGLTPISAHVPIDDMVKDTEGTVAAYAEIGCKFIVVPYVIEERRPGGSKFDQTIEDMKMIGETANKHGMTLLYHNHDFEFVKLSGLYGLDFLYEAVPADVLATELDTCWVKVAGEDPAAYIRKYAGRCPVVHLKDFIGVKKEGAVLYALIQADGSDDVKVETEQEPDFDFRPVGYGKQDIPGIIKAGLESGAQWFIVEQDRSTERPALEAAKMSCDYVRGL